MLCRFQWLTWLTSLFGKKIKKKKICGMFLWMVDLVDFTSWENLEHRKFYMCVAQWLTWLTSLFGKKIEEKKICVTFLSMVDLVDFTFWQKNLKNTICVMSLSMVDLVDFTSWEIIDHKNLMRCVPFSGWLGWLHFLGKNWKNRISLLLNKHSGV